MTASKLPTEFDPVHAQLHGYTREDWDDVSDNPEWTEEDFARARPFREAEPELHASIQRARRGPARTTAPVSIRLDLDLLEKLRASGPGWQRRVNDMIRRSLDAA